MWGMSILLYRNRHGQDVEIRSPTGLDMDKFWDDWLAQHGAEVARVAADEFRKNNALARFIAHE